MICGQKVDMGEKRNGNRISEKKLSFWAMHASPRCKFDTHPHLCVSQMTDWEWLCLRENVAFVIKKNQWLNGWRENNMTLFFARLCWWFYLNTLDKYCFRILSYTFCSSNGTGWLPMVALHFIDRSVDYLWPLQMLTQYIYWPRPWLVHHVPAATIRAPFY